MKIIKPITINDTTLASSNVTEDDYATWASGTAYNTGDKVIVLSTHSIYESLIDSNTGNDPTTDDGTNWLRLSATNRWKAFDQKISDPVVNLNSIEYTFDDLPNSATGITFFGLSGISVNVTVTDPTDGEVYNKTLSLADTRDLFDWFTYFFEEVTQREEAQFVDLPPYPDASVSVTVAAETGQNAQVGQIIVGFLSDIGVTTYGTSISIEDYSRKETDVFGNFIVVERAFAKLADFSIQFPTQNARKIQRTLAQYRATPIVYIGSDDTSYGTTLYGFYRRFDLTLETPSTSFGAIEVEGLT